MFILPCHAGSHITLAAPFVERRDVAMPPMFAARHDVFAAAYHVDLPPLREASRYAADARRVTTLMRCHCSEYYRVFMRRERVLLRASSPARRDDVRRELLYALYYTLHMSLSACARRGECAIAHAVKVYVNSACSAFAQRRVIAA